MNNVNEFIIGVWTLDYYYYYMQLSEAHLLFHLSIQ